MSVKINLIPSDEPIQIKVGVAARKPIPSITLELNIRKSLSGDLMIYDHADIDIVMSSRTNKITAFPKETMNDLVYGAQNRLFTHLRKQGIVVSESIHAAAYYGALEASMETPYDDKLNAAKFALMNISKFIEEERPYFESMEAVETATDSEFVEPDKADSTELGEVPQQAQQGSIRPGYVRDPYTYSYMYTI